jgi:hypothetical protein
MRERGLVAEENFLPWEVSTLPEIRLYGGLTAAQRQLLRTGGAIPFSRLPPQAQQRLRAILEKAAEDNPSPLPPDTFSGELSAPRMAVTWTIHEKGASAACRSVDPVHPEWHGAYTEFGFSLYTAGLIRERGVLEHSLLQYRYRGESYLYFYFQPFVMKVQHEGKEGP